MDLSAGLRMFENALAEFLALSLVFLRCRRKFDWSLGRILRVPCAAYVAVIFFFRRFRNSRIKRISRSLRKKFCLLVAAMKHLVFNIQLAALCHCLHDGVELRLSAG